MSPGPIDTPALNKQGLPATALAGFRADMASRVPLGRIGSDARHRPYGRVPRLLRRRLHHRSGDRRRWRHVRRSRRQTDRRRPLSRQRQPAGSSRPWPKSISYDSPRYVLLPPLWPAVLVALPVTFTRSCRKPFRASSYAQACPRSQDSEDAHR
nr:hypothetical protein [Nonomuraea aurantiaca]